MSLLASGIIVEVDWDNDGDFDEDEEDITAFVLDAESRTGRDWPSQLTGRAGPGLFRAKLDNTDNRFSHFNASSPLNTAPFSLKTGRKLRVRTSGAANPDPALLAKDRFARAAGSLLETENGLTWTNQLNALWVVSDQQAKVVLETDSSGAVISDVALATVNAGSADGYAQITCPHRDHTNTIGIIYRWDDDDNFGAVIWLGQSNSTTVIHYEYVAGVFTATFNSGTIEFQEDTTFGVLVDGTDAHIYVNGVRMASGDAYSSSSTVWGIRGNGGDGRDPVVDDFYVWDGLPTEQAGIIWTGDVSALSVSVETGPSRFAELRGEGSLAKLSSTDVSPPSSVGVTPDNTFGVVSVGQGTGELVGKTLAKAQLLHPPGPLQRGEVTAGSVGLPTGKALDIARQFEELEFGFLYETQEGPIGFDARTARDSSYSLATFSDAPTGSQLGYETIVPFDWRREIINEVSAGSSPVPPNTRTLFGSSVSQSSGVNTDVIVPLPGGSDVAIGDLLVVVITPSVGPATGQQWITPRDWVAFNTSQELGRVRIYAKKVVAADLGASVTFYDDLTPFGGSYQYVIVPLSLWYGDIAQGVAVARPDVQTGSDALTGSGEVPVMFPPWGNETTLFIALRSGMHTTANFTVTNTSPPNGYTSLNTQTVNGTADAYDLGVERAFRAGNSEVESPGRFGGTFTGFTYLEHNLIAVRGFNGSPPPRSGPQLVVSSRLDSQDEHNAVRSHRNPAELFRSKADARTYGDLVLGRYSDDRPIFQLEFTATQSSSHLTQATNRRVSDRITLIADNDTGLDVNDDFHIESITNRWSQGAKLWRVTWELSPAEAVYRADTTESELGAALTATSTTIQINTVEGPAWISSFVYPNMFPFAVQVDSEIIRLLSNTADPDNVSPQFYNVERGIDGTTAASHATSATVALAYPWELP